jgi:hypothetical protein
LTPGGSSTVGPTHIIIKRKMRSAGPSPIFACYTLAFALQLGKKHLETPVRVVEKCPDISVALVQYTFAHKQYREHIETEYT